jgi:Endonuclease/Exonuclease/phosphatase family
MMITSWNCAMGLQRKLASLRSLRPDIAVLSEVASPEKLRVQAPELSRLPIVWVGSNPNKGLAIVSFTGSELALDKSYRDTNQYVAPVHVHGPKPFRLLAVWDHNDRKEGLNRRAGPLLRALDDSLEFCLSNDLVVAGDFNNNPQWDRPNGPNNMARISQELMKRGLVSLYHSQSGLAFGAEVQGTYWQYRNRMKPYHIDYIFVPTAWLENMVSFELGTFDVWWRLSDHAPLIAEFN